MTANHADNRPPAQAVLNHHIFWDKKKSLNFLVDVSNRTKANSRNCGKCKTALEAKSKIFYGAEKAWLPHLCPVVQKYIKDLPEQFVKYKGYSLMELIRLIRNLHNHISEKQVPAKVKDAIGVPPDAFFDYWIEKFPFLVAATYIAFQDMKQDPKSGLDQYYTGKFNFEFLK